MASRTCRAVRWVAVLVGAFAAAVATPGALAQCDPQFEPGPFLPNFQRGTNDQVFASCVWDPDETATGNGYRLPRLVIGGLFVTASGNLTPRVAAWDGTQWTPLGPGFNGVVRALIVFNHELFAAGDFTELGVAPGGTPCLRIAKFNPTTNTWAQVSTGFNAEVRALAVHNGELIAGGSFTQTGATNISRGLARLNFLGNWLSLGSGTNGTVFSLASMTGVGGTRLYAGGAFTQSGAVACNNIAWFDPVNARWNSMGTGCDGGVMAMTPFFNGTTFELIVAGLFNHAGGLASPSAARWAPSAANGTWLAAGAGLPQFSPFGAMNTFDAAYICGRDSTALVYKWNGSAWSAVGPSPSPGQFAFTVRQFEGEVAIGGTFNFIGGGLTCNNVARLHNNAWFPFTAHLNGSINTFFPSNPMIVGGNFEQSLANGGSCANLVRWNPDDNTFSAIGHINGSVMAFAMSGPSFSVPDLYIGGVFTNAGTSATNCNNVARWTPLSGPGGPAASWGPVGAGFTNSNPGLNAPVFAMTTYGFMGSGIFRTPVVHAGGMFTHSGGVLVNAVAKFNGSAWQPLGTTGVTSTNAFCWVNSFATLNNTLIVGGVFDAAGGVTARSVAAWNGTSWSALVAGGGNGVTQAGIKGNVEDLTVFEGSVVVAGRFDHAGAVAVNNVGRWDGTTWHNMSQGLLGPQEEGSALAVHQGDLFLATALFPPSGPTQTRVRRWNGTLWEQVGPAGDGYISTMVSHSGRLHVGGSFAQLGGLDFAYWDRINCVCAADLNGDFQITPADVAMAVNMWAASLSNGTFEGDFDHNGLIQPADIAVFVSLWFAALPGGC